MAIRLANFFGTVPRVAPELLPDAAAQDAVNCKLTSGDIIPYPTPAVFASTARSGTQPTLYALRNGAAYVWLSWNTQVDIATPSSEYTDEQRFYYTGDGVPKVSTYALATSSGAPYPNSYYNLGLPLPTTVIASAFTEFTTKSIYSSSRDSNNKITVVTNAAHELRTGNTVTITGYTTRTASYDQSGYILTVTLTDHGFIVGSEVPISFLSGSATSGTYPVTTLIDADQFTITVPVSATIVANYATVSFTGFNATNVKVTVVDSTTFTYSSVGTQINAGAISQGSVSLDGDTTLRTYVYTWVTPWDEESIGSEPSSDLYCKEGITVAVSNLPTAPPSGNNFIRGIRLYRTLSSTAGADYIRLSTMWFPTRVTHVSRASNVATIRTQYPHMLIVGDRLKISAAANTSFNVTGGVVTEVIDDNNFKMGQVASNVTLTTDSTAVLYHDVSETLSGSARYWGDGGVYDFTDDFDVLNRTEFLTTDEYSEPPENLKGLVSIQNNTLAGFVGKTVYFSEPKYPHAWPIKYAITLEYDIVALATIGTRLYVLTTAYPYAIDGVPGNMAWARLDALYPCLNRASVVKMVYGITYATHDGLAVISSASNTVQLITAKLHSSDTWNSALNPSTISGVYYGDAYFGSHSTGSFIFQFDERAGGYFVTSPYTFTGAWYDTLTNRLFYTSGTSGVVYEWDDQTQPNSTAVWKSKVMIGKDYMNLGAAKVVADFSSSTLVWGSGDTLWNNATNTWNSSESVVFELWADKSLVHTTNVIDKKPFRLPTGYRTDTYEVRVTSPIRVRAVHLGENPLSLKEV